MSCSLPSTLAVGRGVTALSWCDERHEGLRRAISAASHSECRREHWPLGFPVGEQNIVSSPHFLAGRPGRRRILASASLFLHMRLSAPVHRAAQRLRSGPSGVPAPCPVLTQMHTPRADLHPAFHRFVPSHQSRISYANFLLLRLDPGVPKLFSLCVKCSHTESRSHRAHLWSVPPRCSRCAGVHTH